MKLKGEEKHFWWHFRHITDSKNIPNELPGITIIDSSEGDDFWRILIKRVEVVHEIYLKETEITDVGVMVISELKKVKHLTLMKHDKITKACLPYLNRLTDLEYLDVWRTQIRIEDLSALSDLKNLKEVCVSPNDEDDEYTDREGILEKIIKIEESLPHCVIRTSPN
ncbi:hypothetical protein [Pedobacter sp. MW01-1-1]|uniref:hypothetical protein n=1 Tax=Pedobacter sp. MW01-1-1 TaxID=3383027 RepID=UPI003FED4755